jgi:hypothetical protein
MAKSAQSHKGDELSLRELESEVKAEVVEGTVRLLAGLRDISLGVFKSESP